MDETLFYAKKTVTKDDRWELDIDLVFDGASFRLTDGSSIVIDRSDAEKLCPGADLDAPGPFTDTVAIQSRWQFEHVFGSYLADEAQELLCDVYRSRAWHARIIDAEGNETAHAGYLLDDFVRSVAKALGGSGRFWMELSSATSRFNEDWTVSVEDDMTLFSNIKDGFRPLNAKEVQDIIGLFAPVRIYADREEFSGTVTRSGNSLVLKVTDQCRRMGLDVGDEVGVTLDTGTPGRNSDLRALRAQNWSPIEDPDSICHRNGCDLEMVKRFLKDFRVIGTVYSGRFAPGRFENDPARLFDHVNFFKTEDGSNIIVTQPYSEGSKLADAQEWARENGCTAEEHRDYSWHNPPDTTLLVFRLRENPDWRIPRKSDDETI